MLVELLLHRNVPSSAVIVYYVIRVGCSNFCVFYKVKSACKSVLGGICVEFMYTDCYYYYYYYYYYYVAVVVVVVV